MNENRCQLDFSFVLSNWDIISRMKCCTWDFSNVKSFDSLPLQTESHSAPHQNKSINQARTQVEVGENVFVCVRDLGEVNYLHHLYFFYYN